MKAARKREERPGGGARLIIKTNVAPKNTTRPERRLYLLLAIHGRAA